MNSNDIKYVLAAGILAASLILINYGFDWGWYIGIVYLGFNSIITIFASGILLNPDVFPRTIGGLIHRNPVVQFLVQAITLAFLYGLYGAGFIFTSGFFTFMLSMSVVSNIMVYLVSPKGN